MLIVVCLPSCKQNKRCDSAAKIVSEWTGKEVKFPDGLSCISVDEEKRDEKEFAVTLRSNNFRHPVFIDKENETDKINKFPSNPEYQCFLLDKDKNNKVIMIGNAAANSDIWILYKRIITESETKVLTIEQGRELKTSHEINNSTALFSIKKK